jgi:hypothetical protein
VRAKRVDVGLEGEVDAAFVMKVSRASVIPLNPQFDHDVFNSFVNEFTLPMREFWVG